MEDYEQRGIPLDTLVTDMDWHITFYKEADKGQKDQVRLVKLVNYGDITDRMYAICLAC